MKNYGTKSRYIRLVINKSNNYDEKTKNQT